LPVAHIDDLGDLYRLFMSPNAELLLRFYQVALLDPKSAKSEHYATVALGWVVGEEDGMVKGRNEVLSANIQVSVCCRLLTLLALT
jgi:leukotriene-A4 hydrolase